MRHQVGYCGLILAILLSYSEQLKINTASQGADCSDIKRKNHQASSGVYWIQPKGLKAPFEVYCEMRSDGGWTVFQKRSGALPFNRFWASYKNGFGNLTHDYWLGLKKIFALTKAKTTKWTLRVDLWDHEGNTAFAEYSNFKLGNEKSGFKLSVKTYKGTAGDAIREANNDQNGFGFSTADRDNDGCKPCVFEGIIHWECAALEGGGWWFSRCGLASLNGEYHRAGDHMDWESGLHWDTWKTGTPYSLKATRMMIKPVE